VTRRQWVLLLCLFLLSLPAVTTRIYSSDEIQYFAYLRSLWFDRDLSFENEYRYFYDRGIAQSEGFRQTFLERETEAGRRVNFGTIGCAILWAPFYATGDLAARASSQQADGLSKPYIAAVAYGSAVYGFAAIVLAMLSAQRLGLAPLPAALAVWIGTPLLFYMYVAPPFSHACSAFAVALFVWTWLKVRTSWSVPGVLALGVTGALMAMVREQDVFFVAGPAVDFVLSAFRFQPSGPAERTGVPRTVRPDVTRLPAAVAGVLAFAVTFLPQAIAYVRLNGHLGPSRLVTRKMSWHAPHALQVLFSPEHGYFVWTPLALIAIAGLTWLGTGGSLSFRVAPSPAAGSRARLGAGGGGQAESLASDMRRIAGCMLLMIALQIYVGGSVESWTVAGGFGQRRFVALTVFLVIGLAALMLAAGRRAFAIVAALAVYWNLALIAEFATGLMDRQRLEPANNAYDAVVTLPRQAPSLVYRYLFDRGSFYRGPSSDDRGPAGRD
jgi:hypothetical protein